MNGRRSRIFRCLHRDQVFAHMCGSYAYIQFASEHLWQDYCSLMSYLELKQVTILSYDVGYIKAFHYKGVFVKHDKAPTAPKLEGVWFLE